MPQRLTTISISAALLVGSAAGCGSSSKSTSTAKAAPAITKPQYVAKANAICTGGDALTNKAAAKLGNSPTAAQIVTLVKKVDAPEIQSEISAIRALGAPSGDQATVTNFLNLAEADVKKVARNPLLLAGKTSPFADFAKVAHPYGLTACAPS